jgi:hypothetical protein
MAERGERAEGNGSGRGDAGPWLASGVGPKGFPGSVFIFFSPLLLFLFCFLNSFTDFCKNVPNQFKPLSEILKKITARF